MLQVPTYPPCGCGFIKNHEELEGRVALIERGECSFVSKVVPQLHKLEDLHAKVIINIV